MQIDRNSDRPLRRDDIPVYRDERADCLEDWFDEWEPERQGNLIVGYNTASLGQTFWDIWTRCLQDCRIRHRGIYALKDTFVTHTLVAAEESGEVERLTAWLVRQTGVRLDTLKQHYERWWPRDPAAIRATYALLARPFRGKLTPGPVSNPGKTP